MKATAILFALSCASLARADALVDPMHPPSLASRAISPSTPLQVTAIIFSGMRRIAIVNGKAVSAGEHIGDAHIDSIDEDAVNYSRGGRRESARLPTQAVAVRQQATQ